MAESKEAKELQKQIFVAYSYALYDKDEYRKVFTGLEKSYDVKFIFADEKITNMHILQKIISYIRASDFSLFDISGWNPNVTLELGIAMQHSEHWYICFNPEKTPLADVPSDIKGIDRIQYASFDEFREQLTVLLEQRYPKAGRQQLADYFASLSNDVHVLLHESPGLRMDQIAQILNVEVKVAQIIVGRLLGTRIRVEGKKRGAKYFLIENSLPAAVAIPEVTEPSGPFS